jgi:hypothetical protein
MGGEISGTLGRHDREKSHRGSAMRDPLVLLTRRSPSDLYPLG